MKVKRRGSATWTGGAFEGRGSISSASGALCDFPYGAASRFEGRPGSNPEELLAAAHAACFTMALTLVLGQAGLKADALRTEAEVTLEEQDGDFVIPAVHLTVRGQVADLSLADFQAHVARTHEICPVSKLFRAEITHAASLDAAA
ncbi:OsmC family peroxiredoxin [Phenylobacterium deserti]|uniref:OsmC family peroxiredoxin n=1 Tax=Phenylobacterium deserti TaxID=1914756 RepID=A0A328AEF4_9CAUL|nr:OsmC family peroxiredoxin [Phenylobacterium deserti]